MSAKPQAPSSQISVLFIDATGTSLAPMAEALLRQLGNGKFIVQSGGVEATGTLNEACMTLLKANQIAVDKLSCKDIVRFQTPEASVKIDIVVRLGAKVAGLPPKLYGVPAKVDWPIEDPAEAGTSEQAAWKAKKAFTALKQRIEEMAAAKLPETKGELQMAVQKIGKGL